MSVWRDKGSAGYTLIETLAALLVFSIVTLGVVPLLASSLRGSNLSRSFTRGKSVAVQAMERVRGLPFFESVKNQTTPARVDVLDLYFPDRVSGSGAGYISSGDDAGTFKTVCSASSKQPSASATLACPINLSDGSAGLPQGYTLTYSAAFVSPVTTDTPQSFQVTPPPSDYSWSSVTTELPPSQLLRLNITAEWALGGRTKQFSLASLIGPRRLTPDKLRATARTDYAVQAFTSFTDPLGRTSSLVATAGRSTSAVEIQATAAAETDVRAAQLTLTRGEFEGTPGSTFVDESGASVVLRAPPNSFPAPDASAGSIAAINTDLVPAAQVAFADATLVNDPGAEVVNELPKTSGPFEFTGGGELFWVNNQADTRTTAALKLDPTAHVLSVAPFGGGKISGSSSAETTPTVPASLRRVETAASASIGRLLLLPTTFIPGDKAVLSLFNFAAATTCRSTGSASTSTASATWSSTLRYYRDANLQDGGIPVVEAVDVPFNSDNAATVLADLKSTNPIVFDGLTDQEDVHLFRVTDSTGNVLQNGYLDSFTTTSPKAIVEATGATSASLDSAIGIITAPTDPQDPNTSLNVALGKLSCEAVDKRA